MAHTLAFSPRYDAALVLAAQAHQQQLRKGSSIPYIVHPVHVSVILLRHGYDEEMAIAGLLHDVMEDCGIARQDLAARFGERVASLVEAVSKPSPALSWEDARAAMIARLETGGPEVAALKAADTLHNIQSTLHDLQREGPAIWERFKRGPGPICAYYRAVLQPARRWLGEHPLATELDSAVQEFEQAITPVRPHCSGL